MERSSSRCVSRCRRRSGSSYLPEDLIFKILSWTCVTSLFRCRSVCKLWLSIISKPEFIKAQHINSSSSSSSSSSILMITSSIDSGCLAANIVYPNSPVYSVNLPLMPPFDNIVFVSSCNGIVCVNLLDYYRLYRGGDIYLFNPLTRMSKKLPPPISYANPRQVSSCDVAFGFDCLSGDFKVLQIAYERIDDKLVNVLAMHLYSSNSDLWREMEVGIALPSLLCYPHCPILRSGPVVDGVLYLEAVNTIVTFDLHNELFGLIPYPSFMHQRKSNLLDFKGSVAVVLESILDRKVSLWTVESVSDDFFWNKMFTFDAGLEERDWVFLYCDADKFVGKTSSGTVLYDYRKEETTYIKLPSRSFLAKVLKLTESFLSVEELNGVQDS